MRNVRKKKRAEQLSPQWQLCIRVRCQDLDLGLARDPKQEVNLAPDLRLALLQKAHKRKERNNHNAKRARSAKGLQIQNLSMDKLRSLITKIPPRASRATTRSRS